MKITFQYPDACHLIEWKPGQSTFLRINKQGAITGVFSYRDDGNGVPPTIEQAYQAAIDDFTGKL